MDLKNLAETIYLEERELSQRIGGKVTVTIYLGTPEYYDFKNSISESYIYAPTLIKDRCLFHEREVYHVDSETHGIRLVGTV
jgi:hypothetical protein